MKNNTELLKIIAAYLKEYGFKKKGKLFYHLEKNLSFCIEFEFIGSNIYLAHYIIPLYIPHDCRAFTYGNRVPVRSVSDPQELSNQIIRYLDSKVIPIFKKKFDCESLVEMVLRRFFKSDFFFTPHMFKMRLAFFTYAYCGNREKAFKFAQQYDASISAATWMIDSTKDLYRKEIADIIELLSNDAKETEKWFTEVIDKTKKTCGF